MPLFQQSVVNKYLNDVNKTDLQIAWQVFTAHFHNRAMQENIRNLKEEEYQEGFVRDLFVTVLGYTLNPQPGFNFVLEKKSVTDASKSDGAILLNNHVIAVIELKDTGTVDLEKVSNQAFGYKHKHKNCTYVITANFEKLRFYINDATEFEEFNLFTLSLQRFALLYLCLQQKNLLDNIPLQIKQQSVAKEEHVTKQLYADYSVFKRKLFQNIAAQNPQHDKLLLFKKTQKLLDRFLFIFFSEDRLLLPPNSVREILQQWEDLKTKYDEYFPLYDRFKKYFGYLNVGHAGKQHEIFAYNGGLFLPDEILDNILIDDTILYDGAKALSNYDFETDVDVNILGHIFEHSLTEIEELQATLEGTIAEKKITKRKKDGVFYTPRYITKYIVENTVGALCTQQKEKLQINEETFAPQKRKDRRRQLLDTIETYRAWLLQLTICDPACGSGAFLNAALEYLKEEHRTIDELKATLFGDTIVYTDIDNSILENNLFGVDINEEATEIAKLSLWLHTAKKGRKLSNLSNNIKCGNSLIDDAGVAGDKAFVWKEEFKTVFENGGFDVVIGNPPYVKVQNLTHNQIDWFKKNKKVAYKRIDISLMFFELAKNLLKENGFLSYITSNQFLVTEYGKKAREFILENFRIKTIIDYADLPVFEDALTYVSVFTFQNNLKSDFLYKKVISIDEAKQNLFKDFISIDIKKLNENNWLLLEDTHISLLNKLDKISPLIDCAKSSYGIVSGNDNIFIITEKVVKKFLIEKECLLPLIRANNCYRYGYSDFNCFIIYPYYYQDGNTNLIPINELQEKCPCAYNYLLNQKSELEKRKDSRTTFENASNWYSLTRFGQIEIFKKEKIVCPGEQNHTKFGLDLNNAGYSGARVFSITTNDENTSLKFLLTILNSRLIEFYIHSNFPLKQGGYYSFSSTFLNKIPIKNADLSNQKPFIEKADIMLSKNKELQQLSQQFTQLLQAKISAININKKLENWYSLTGNEFLKEISKQKIKLPLAEQQEWLQYFEEQKATANIICNVITETDTAIDQMVYALYGLSEEEVRVVEGGNG